MCIRDRINSPSPETAATERCSSNPARICPPMVTALSSRPSAAALAVIDTIATDGLLDNAVTIGGQIRAGLLEHRSVAAVSGEGLLIGIVLKDDIAKQVQSAALNAGLILNNPTVDRLRMAPPLNLTAQEAELAIRTLQTVLDEVAPAPQGAA